MITVIIFLKSNLTNQKQSWLQFKHGIHFGEVRRVKITWAVHNRWTHYSCRCCSETTDQPFRSKFRLRTCPRWNLRTVAFAIQWLENLHVQNKNISISIIIIYQLFLTVIPIRNTYMDVKVFGRKRIVCVNRKITVEARVQQVQEKISAPCTRFTSRSNAAKIDESSHAHTNMLFLPRKCEKFVKCPVSNLETDCRLHSSYNYKFVLYYERFTRTNIYDKYWITKYELERLKMFKCDRKERKFIRKIRILTRSVRLLRKNTKKLTYKKIMLTFILIWTRKEYSKWTYVTNNKRLRNATPRTKKLRILWTTALKTKLYVMK